MKILQIIREAVYSQVGGIRGKKFEITMPDRAKSKGWVLVAIKKDSFDAAWSSSEPEGYLSKGGEGGSSKPGAYAGMQKWIEENDTIEAPEVQVNPGFDIHFINGRHRYALLKDIGANPIIVSMSKESATIAKQSRLIY